jgi:hypothetical protein
MEVNAQFEMTDLCCAWQWGKRTDCTDSVQCIVVEFDITGARRHLNMADAPISLYRELDRNVSLPVLRRAC